MRVHPLFDIEEKVWVYGNTIAPTLRELKEHLPSEVEIVGYYPSGYEAPFFEVLKDPKLRPVNPNNWGRSTSQKALKIDRSLKQTKSEYQEKRYYARQKHELQVIEGMVDRQKMEAAKVERATTKQQRDEKILIAAGKGTQRVTIALDLKISIDTVRDVLKKARQLGDARPDVPILRVSKPRKLAGKIYKSVWTPERDEFVRANAALGKSAGRIAYELGENITKNAVIGRARRIKVRLNQH